MKQLAFILLIGLAISQLLAVIPSAAQQSQPPQARYYVGEGSVDLYRGVFSYSNVDIVAGSGPAAISLERYNGVRAYGSGPFGFTTGHNQEIRVYRERFLEDPWGPDNYSYRWHVVIGRNVELFDDGMGTYSITYQGKSKGFHSFTKNSNTGPFTYKGPNGLIINFGTLVNCGNIGLPATMCAVATSMTTSDGTAITYQYDALKQVRLVTNNRGFGLGFTYRSDGYHDTYVSTVCALNLAQIQPTIATPCPSGVKSAQYTWIEQPYGGPKFTKFTDASGRETGYDYDVNCVGLNSISDVASAQNQLTVSFDGLCRVQSQSFGGGQISISYAYANTWGWDIMPFNDWTTETKGGSTVTHNFQGDPLPISRVDALGRIWGPVEPSGGSCGIYTQPPSGSPGYFATYGPEGDSVVNTCALLDLVESSRKIAKPGSGLPDIVVSSTYPSPGSYPYYSACVNAGTCEKPLSRTDAKGNVTTFTYDPSHGGILTETGPTVNGIAPVKRYSYVQRQAWISNGTGGYVQTGQPLWLLTEERTCNSTATTGNTCAGGAADETVVSYDYGPDSGPNNLLLRGKAVSSGGAKLRSCIGYDTDGRKISETAPNANLSACP